MKNKICFIMPVYPPHYQYAREFIASYFKHKFKEQADLAFVFSDEKDLEAFREINFEGYYIAILLPEILNVSREDGIINVKKFYALQSLQGKYEYFIIIDAESELIKDVDLRQLCKEFYDSKVLFGNHTKNNSTHIRETAKKFFDNDLKQVENNDLYLWFNQPCIYKDAFLKEFFDIIGFHSLEDFSKLVFHTFDYYIYMYYLIFYKNFQIIDIEVNAIYGFLEGIGEFNAQSQEYKNYKFLLCRPHLYQFLNQEKLFLFIHKRNHERKPIIKPKVIKQTPIPSIYLVSKDRIHSHLAYKLGQALILNSKSLLGYIRMPYVLSYIKEAHQKEQKEYQARVAKNPKLKLPKLESYPDYKEALKEKQCFTYKLGEALIKANSVRGGGRIFAYLAFFQEVRELRKELKEKRK